ncbi:hypothetical protein V1517DRAFT_363807 [Lipomyces orientalis]|uniref:Uncharacterized protein n=1 Tax=Lipomyces orientalis TaxID=1233043 RepID=A0ACC3TIL4_9ASCO
MATPTQASSSSGALIGAGHKAGFYGDFPKLKGEENYLSWKQNMLLHLRAFQLVAALSYEGSVESLSVDERLKNGPKKCGWDWRTICTFLVGIQTAAHDMSHLRDQLTVVGMAIDDAMFVEVFLRSLTVFYTDALPALLTATDLTSRENALDFDAFPYAAQTQY